jgi:hypothetical protein
MLGLVLDVFHKHRGLRLTDRFDRTTGLGPKLHLNLRALTALTLPVINSWA